MPSQPDSTSHLQWQGEEIVVDGEIFAKGSRDGGNHPRAIAWYSCRFHSSKQMCPIVLGRPIMAAALNSSFRASYWKKVGARAHVRSCAPCRHLSRRFSDPGSKFLTPETFPPGPSVALLDTLRRGSPRKTEGTSQFHRATAGGHRFWGLKMISPSSTPAWRRLQRYEPDTTRLINRLSALRRMRAPVTPTTNCAPSSGAAFRGNRADAWR